MVRASRGTGFREFRVDEHFARMRLAAMPDDMLQGCLSPRQLRKRCTAVRHIVNTEEYKNALRATFWTMRLSIRFVQVHCRTMCSLCSHNMALIISGSHNMALIINVLQPHVWVFHPACRPMPNFPDPTVWTAKKAWELSVRIWRQELRELAADFIAV